MFGSFGWMELVLILIIVMIVFGAGKLPQLGEGLGKAIKGFKKTVHEPDAIDVTPPDRPHTSQAEAQQRGPAQAEPEPSAPRQASQPGQVKHG